MGWTGTTGAGLGGEGASSRGGLYEEVAAELEALFCSMTGGLLGGDGALGEEAPP